MLNANHDPVGQMQKVVKSEAKMMILA